MATLQALPPCPPLLFDPQLRDRLSYFVGQGRALLATLRPVDLGYFEPLGADTAVPAMLREPAQTVLTASRAAATLLAQVPTMLPGAAPLEVEADDSVPEFELMFGAVDSPDDVIEGAPQPEHDTLCEELDALLRAAVPPNPTRQLVDTCALLVWQLNEARRRLRVACRQRSKWAMITEGEETRRKTRKALRAALTLAARLLGPTSPQGLFPNETSELSDALLVRATLMRFRRDILVLCADAVPRRDWELGISLCDVRLRFLALFAEPGYRALRAIDRFELQQLRGRLDAWLDAVWDDFIAARRLLTDIGAFVSLLQQVNRRQSLMTHDSQVRQRVLPRLHALLDGLLHGGDIDLDELVSLVQQVEPLRWRDDRLDAAIDAVRFTPGQRLTVDTTALLTLRERLSALA